MMAISMRNRLLSLASIALFAATGSMAADATQMRAGAERSGATSERADLSLLDTFTTSVTTKITAGAIYAEPLVIGSTVYVLGDNAGESSDLVALDAESGNVLWRNTLPARATATPAAAFGVIVIGTTGGEAIAYSTSDGSELWKRTHAGNQTGAIAIEGDRVVVAPGFGNESLLCLNLFSGDEHWRIDLENFANGAPAMFDGKVILALPNGSIEAYSLEDGSEIWKAEFEATSVYFGATPTIAHDEVNGITHLFIAPGGEEADESSSISGFKGYVTYRVDVNTGSLERIIPGKDSSAPSFSDGVKPASEQGSGENPLASLPAKLQRELSSYSDVESKIRAMESWETLMGYDFSDAKDALRAETKARADRKAARALRPLASTSGSVLPGHDFDVNWPSAANVRPASAAYLARGINRFLAVSMLELGSELGTPDRALLFSIDPTDAGDHRWFYAGENLDSSDQTFAPSPIFVPKSSDANGAWLVAPLGCHLAVFDALGSNTPVAQYLMPATIQAAPVYANGRLIITDREGNLRILKSNNSAPSRPQIGAPASNVDITNAGDVTLGWSAANDDSSATNQIAYQVQLTTWKDGVTSASMREVSAGVTSYALSGIEANTDVSFAIRAIDADGLAGEWSESSTFSYLPDRQAPYPVDAFTLKGGPLSLDLSFDASPDEAPKGAADVKTYVADIIDMDGSDSYTISLGLAHNYTVDGANPATPLIAGHRYNVRLMAKDGRGNTSLSIIRSATVLTESEFDIIPPHVSSAKVLDLGGRGVIDGVEVTFSEDIDFANLNINGFALGGVAARSFTKISESTILLDFGSGVLGTGTAELTYNDQTGGVYDLKGNALRSIAAGDVTESDSARPVLLQSSIIAHDDNGDGRPDRIVARFSEPVDQSSLELADVLSIKDNAGVSLKATGVSLSADGIELTITLEGGVGSLNGIAIELSDDGNGNFISDQNGNALTAIESNLAPVVHLLTAPAGQTIMPGIFRLDASKSVDPDGDDSALAYTWSIDSSNSRDALRFVESGEATYAGGPSASIIFSEVGYYGLRLEVRDQAGRVTTKLLNLRVINQAPVTNAGEDRIVRVGTTASLFGNRSYDANSNATLEDWQDATWTLVSGPQGANPTINNADSLVANFATNGLPLGEYEFKLAINDRSGAASSDRVRITLIDGDTLTYSANLGPTRRIQVGQALPVVAGLRGFSNAAQITWSATPVNLVNTLSENGNQASFNFLSAGLYTISFTAEENGQSRSASLVVEASVSGIADVPVLVVDAPSASNAHEVINISTARSTDQIGQGLVTEWRHLSGPLLSEVARSADSLSLVAAAAGTARIEVWVNDGSLSSRRQVVEIQVHRGDTHLPQARAAGERVVDLGESLSLDLSASTDADGHNLTYSLEEIQMLGAEWAINGTTLTITPAMAGKIRFALRAHDVSDISTPTLIEISVQDPARSYFASATASDSNIDLNLSNQVDLQATAPAGVDQILWVQSVGASAEIADPTSFVSSVSLPMSSGSYEFTLYGLQDGEWAELDTLSLSATGTETVQGSAPNVGSSGGCVLAASSATYGVIGAVIGVIVVLMMGAARRKEDEVEV